jgi:hypothetical protein
MNNKIILLIAVIALSSISNKVTAQASIWNLTYNIGITTGEFNDHIGKASFRGFGIEGRGFLNDNISLGGMFSWAVFAEQVDALESTELFDASGLQNRYVNAYPINFNGHYYFGEPYETRFFIGAGLGAYRMDRRTEFGLYGFENNNWQFGFYPEVGVVIPVGFNNSGIYTGLKWHNALSNSEVPGYSWISLDIGISFIN